MPSVKEIYAEISEKERQSHFEKTDRGKMKCTLTGHELPNRKEDLKNYTDKNQKFMNEAVIHKLTKDNDDFQELEDGKIYCIITGRVFNKKADDLLAHINGHRYQKDKALFLKTGETFADRMKKQEKAMGKDSDDEENEKDESIDDMEDDDEVMSVEDESEEEDEEEESEDEEEEEPTLPPAKKMRSLMKAQLEKANNLKRKHPGTGNKNKQKIKKR